MHTYITISVSILVLLLCTALLFGSYSRVETAQGILVPNGISAKVFARHDGVIDKIFVKEGQIVQAGQRLAIVRTEFPNINGLIESQQLIKSNMIQQSSTSKQIIISKDRSNNEIARLNFTIVALKKQCKILYDQLEVQRKLVDSISTSYKKIMPVVERGYVSRLEFERRHQSLLNEEENTLRIQQQIESAILDIKRSEAEKKKVELENKLDAANNVTSMEMLKQQNEKMVSENNYSVVSPISGRVTSIQINVGNNTVASMPLMVIIPDGSSLKADIFLPSKAIGFVKQGQEVRLLYDAFPYQKFGTFSAKIATVSHFAISPQETNAPFKIEEPVYKLTAIPKNQEVLAYGKNIHLQPGMTLRANIILERESFIQWIVEPIKAATNRKA